MMLMAATGASAAPSTQSQWEGEPVCGGVDLKTKKLQPACGFAKASYDGKARKSCPSGWFFDLGTWSCFRCPAGLNRTANDIAGDAACSKAVPKQFARAVFKQKAAQCPAGTFFDLRNAGECWQCPSGYGRTASAVDAWDACGKAFAKARAAELVAKVCPDGSFGDLRNGGECWSCPDGYLRTSLPVNGAQACYRTEVLTAAERLENNICKVGSLFDPIDGGTCWTCPEKTVRTVFHVKGPDACELAEIVWKSAPRDPKSLFHIPGGVGVTKAVISERTGIETAATNLAKHTKTDAAKVIASEWQAIKVAPETSGALLAAVYGRVIELIKNGAKTKDERDLLAYFALYIQDTRRLTAYQMHSVYANWKSGNAQRASKLTKAGAMYNIGTTPPDVNKVVNDALALSATGMMIGGAALMASVPSLAPLLNTSAGGLIKAILPNLGKVMTMKVAEVVAEGVAVTGPQVAKEVAKNSILSALGGSAGAAVAGPMLMLTGAMMVGGLGIDIIVKNAEMEAKIEDALKTAQQPVNLKRLLLTDNGQMELVTNWAIMTQATSAPSVSLMSDNPAANYSGPATVANANVVDLSGVGMITVETIPINVSMRGIADMLPGTSWRKIGRKAMDVAIATDGTAYIVSTEGSLRDGFKIYKSAKDSTQWVPVPGATGYRIALEGDTPWLATVTGEVFRYRGGKWEPFGGKIPKGIIDIGASPKGVWMVGPGGVILKKNRETWQQVDGKALRIDVDWDGTPWIVTEQNEIQFRRGNGWVKTKGLAIDVSVDKPGFTKVVGTDGKIYSLSNGSWSALTQNGVAGGIGVGAGQIWGITKDGEVFKRK